MPNSKLVTSSTGDRSFDHYARLVRRFLRVPVALVTLVEADRQVFCGLVGLEGPYGVARQTPLSHSFCQYVVADEKPLVIADARLDPRLSDNLAIPDLNVIAYAGWPLRDAAGATVGSLCAIDSTPRTWKQEDLDTLEDLAHACSAELQGMWRQAEDNESLLRSIFDAVDVAILFYDTEHKLVIANSVAEQAADLVGFALDEPPYAGPEVRRADNLTPIPLDDQFLPKALRGELEEPEMEWVGPPGQEIAFIASALDVRYTDGTKRGMLITANDVTELARSINLKDEFITTVSHELRTPLTSIIGYLEILDEELDVEGGLVGNALDTIRRNSVRLLERVQQLLDTADRRRDLALKPTDLDALARGVAKVFAKEARAAGIELSTTGGAAIWATVDAAQMEQALENLVSNAIKYIGTGTRVQITSETCGETSRIDVVDDGVGMTPDEIAQACTTFWRSQSALKNAVQGFGLGLTLVRDIVEAHRGSLTIESSPDRGTTATLIFPTSPEAPAAAWPLSETAG